MAESYNWRLNIPPYVELQRFDHEEFNTVIYAVLEGSLHNPYYSLVVVTTRAAAQENQVVPENGMGGGQGGRREGQNGGGQGGATRASPQ